MNIEAVIGANYGDEGKGMLTEHLCRECAKPVVVLSNGGCQRGHTVNNYELGVKHIFHHFGSGTLLGAPTVFSKTFLLNPIMFIKEHEELVESGIDAKSWRAPSCVLQLPSDMYVNQQLEQHRAKSGSQHGSCGWGIWETKVRNAEHKKLLFEEFAAMSCEDKLKTLDEALDWQLESRLKDISIDEELLKTVRSRGFKEHFINDFEAMRRLCPAIESDRIVDFASSLNFETVVVENAQGLLLDKKYAPKDSNGRTDIHTTPSQTGLEGALEALGDRFSANEIATNYVSRSYLTRHGNGPFPEYDPSMKFSDSTNVYNDYQGTMRFGRLNVEELLERVKADSAGSKKVNIFATHMNEIDNCELKKISTMVSYEDDSRKFKQI